MTTPRPGSILLGSRQPAELRNWYRKALAPAYGGEGPIDLGGFHLVIEYRDDIGANNNEAGGRGGASRSDCRRVGGGSPRSAVAQACFGAPSAKLRRRR
jgi:hypothetical protein